MAKREITQAQMRRELKDMGYGVRTRQGSEFSTATVTLDGDKINGGNVLTPEFLNEHREFFDWKNSVSVIDDGWRTIL
ncbi:hypothetical protein [uncultured Salinicola sp.]|uniref:hypothetical protein n=1 Tax=uncultured Salinicola sp. TaxID=1193542 RepID=UPI002612BB2C|nr:hypothetical protein [uncultured Salinicola sp.]|tara:strand:+ start:1582 stop:1815 length:234 start_codon:yes stop_codon:yes gene_type:complete